MMDSLVHKLLALPDDTVVYPATVSPPPSVKNAKAIPSS